MIRIMLAGLVAGAMAVACKDASDLSNDPDPIPTPDPSAQGCARTSVGLTPLSDLGRGSYRGELGGLYPGGVNVMPAPHLAAGLTIARGIEPLDVNGQPSPSGRYAFISIGMSNTTQEFSTFVPMAVSDSTRHPQLSVIDGAQGGQTAADWANPNCQCWTVLDNRLRQANISAQQVVAAWVKLADRQPTSGWPAYATTLKDSTIVVLQRLKSRFPNFRLAYLSSRIYAGYATTTLNPEPYAYESGFSMRWVIEQQLTGAAGMAYTGANAVAPWVAWGPYLWADGLTPRSDGLTWSCSDLSSDGTHPSVSGRQKVAQRLLDFVRNDPTAREWYLR